MGITRKSFDYAKSIFERCLSEEAVNSRVIYLFHGLLSGFGILIIVIGFAIGRIHDGADMMVLALSGQAGAASVGRFLTKKNGNGPQTEEEPTDPDKKGQQ